MIYEVTEYLNESTMFLYIFKNKCAKLLGRKDGQAHKTVRFLHTGLPSLVRSKRSFVSKVKV